MKKKVKKLLALGLAVMMMVAASVVGTIAYLTGKDTVVNTFTVGKVNILLDEAKVDQNGTPIGGRVDSNDYKLIPGQTYTKDPTMWMVEYSEPSYLRMMVTITKFSDVKAVFGEDFLPENYVQGWDKTKWIPTGEPKVDVGNNSVTYEFRYFEVVGFEGDGDPYEDEVKQITPLFHSFKVPGEVKGEDLVKLQGMEIRVEGHAIQAASFEGNVDAAWAAFDGQVNP